MTPNLYLDPASKMHEDDKPSYDGWLVRVNAHLLKISGLTTEENFPDHNLKPWFDLRMLPEVAAARLELE